MVFPFKAGGRLEGGGRGWRGDRGSRQERIGRRQQLQHALEERQFLPKPLQAQLFLCVVTFTSQSKCSLHPKTKAVLVLKLLSDQ